MPDLRNLTIACPECGTETKAPWGEASEKVEHHNENMHEGESVAGIKVFDQAAGVFRIVPTPEEVRQYLGGGDGGE